MIDEQGAREVELVTREIQCGDPVGTGEQRIELLAARFHAIRAAEHADRADRHAGLAGGFIEALEHHRGHRGRIERMRQRHEPRAEAHLEVIESLRLAIEHALVRHAPAGIEIGEHPRHQLDFCDEREHARLRLGDLEVRSQADEIVGRQPDPVFPCEIEHGFEPDRTFEMAVEVDPRQGCVHGGGSLSHDRTGGNAV